MADLEGKGAFTIRIDITRKEDVANGSLTINSKIGWERCARLRPGVAPNNKGCIHAVAYH